MIVLGGAYEIRKLYSSYIFLGIKFFIEIVSEILAYQRFETMEQKQRLSWCLVDV